MSKFLILHSSNEPIDDLKSIDKLGSVLIFRDTFLSYSVTEVLAIYDVVIIDVTKFKDWYASYRGVVAANPAVRVIFFFHAHVHIDKDIKDKLINDYKCHSIIKEIPVSKDKPDLITKLLSSHLDGLDLSTIAASSCFKSLLYTIVGKLGCGVN